MSSKEVTSQAHALLNIFFRDEVGTAATIPPIFDTKDFYSDVIRGLLNLNHLHRGRISCLLSVKPAVTMEKPLTSFVNKETTSTKTFPPEMTIQLGGFFKRVGVSKTIPQSYDGKDFYSDLIRGLLKVNHVGRGKLSCLVCVKAVVTNAYGGLHGGAVAAVAEMVAVACARTVVGKDKELFLGELSMSYLSAAPRNAEVMVDASVVRSGRNLTVVAVEFRIKESEKLVYTSRATFYTMPASSL